MAAIGLLRIPEERAPPEVLKEASALAAVRAGDTVGEAVARLAGDPALLAAHHAMLPGGGARQTGDYAAERLIARAKIEDSCDLTEALALLTPREKAAALGDEMALEKLIQLGRP